MKLREFFCILVFPLIISVSVHDLPPKLRLSTAEKFPHKIMNPNDFLPENNTCDTIIKPNSTDGFIKAEISTSLVPKRHSSKFQVKESMKAMDDLYKTSFSSWIKSELNMEYICTFKKKLFREYLELDQKSAMYALEWMVEDWSTESVAEFILKMFYSDRISSVKFAERVYGIIHSWQIERIQELLPILLVGEQVEVCASFMANWLLITRWNSAKLAELIYPIAVGFQWDNGQMYEFLMEYVVNTVKESSSQRSLILVVYEEFDHLKNTDRRAFDIFELIFHLITDESNDLSYANVQKELSCISISD
jgi:hypothetical protein